jgi:hypothetical protein
MAGGKPRALFGFKVRDGKVIEIELACDADRLSTVNVELLP